MSIGIISWIVIGLIAGILGKLIMPGRDPGGFLLTIVIGMIGALVGGFVVQLLGGTGVTGFNIWSILVATLGAIILLALYRAFAGGSRSRRW
jgi:TatA/E family protein of Tat protein translocase